LLSFLWLDLCIKLKISYALVYFIWYSCRSML
jgi:hypothetical protein